MKQNVVSFLINFHSKKNTNTYKIVSLGLGMLF